MAVSLIILLLLAFIIPFILILKGANYLDRDSWYAVVGGFFVSNVGDGVLIISAFAITLISSSGLNSSIIYNVLFTFLCLFIPRVLFATYFYIRAYNNRNKLHVGQGFLDSGRSNLNSQLLLIFAIAFTVSWVILSEYNAILDPRLAYQMYRDGIGFVWAFMITFTILWYANAILEKKKVSFWRIALLFFIAYSSGSKQVFVGCALLVTLQPFISNKLRWKIVPLGLVAGIIFFLFMFGQFSSKIALTERLFNYLETTSLASIIFDMYNKGDLNFYYGEIFLSSFWFFVPRAVFPEKPYEYGATFLLGEFFPGMAATGATPSFGFATLFADFGWFGCILTVISFRFLLQIWAAHLITAVKPTSHKAAAFAILFFPFYSFHVPLQITILAHLIITKLKTKKLKI